MIATSRLKSAQSTLRRASQELLASKTTTGSDSGFPPGKMHSSRISTDEAQRRSTVAEDQASTAARALLKARGKLMSARKGAGS